MANIDDDLHPVHTVYLASRDGTPFLDDDRAAVQTTVLERFESFTLMDADGFFEGRPKSTLVIKIATRCSNDVEELCMTLGSKLDQITVGLETSGKFRSIRTG